MKPSRNKATFLAATLMAAFLSACAGNAKVGETSAPVPYDPWESLNRPVYAVNDFVDRYTLKPIAKVYTKILPSFVRRGVTNFSQNLRTPNRALNNFLQGKPGRGVNEVARFLFNSILGIGGLFDVATAGGMPEYDEDFGQTFAVWGIPQGPYVYLPLFGPSTVRDAFGLPLDFLADPLTYVNDSSVRDPIYVLRAINLRARLLSTETLLEGSNDPYLTIRESYLQNRRYNIYDGDPPMDDNFYDDFQDDPSTPDDSTDNTAGK